MTNRFIEKEELPDSLWSGLKNQLILPEPLVHLWSNLLKENNLEELAKEKAPKSFIGGISKEDTDKHLAWRYNGSCARVLLSIIDPKHELKDVSATYSSAFAGGRVFLADIPSGSGATSITILSTLYELRKNNVLPRIPLSINLVAGEISQTAINYFKKQLDGIAPSLEEQAIWVDSIIVEWDVLDSISTSELISTMTIKAQKCSSRILVLSNFSGFLESKGKWKSAQRQLDEIFRHSRGISSTAIWIEPQKNNVQSFRDRVINWFTNIFKPLINIHPATEWYAQAVSECKQPIKEGEFRVNLTVMQFDLPLKKKNV